MRQDENEQKPPLKIIFAGTPEFAASHLQVLLNSQHKVCAVYTQPDRPAGRGKKLTPSPVKALAVQHALPVEQPSSLREESTQTVLQHYGADLMVVVAYGLLLPQAVLDIPRLGCINVHASLLPRWRGAAPIQRAIESGDSETGVTIMQMEAGLDTGPMWLMRRCAIAVDDTTASLHDRLVTLGGPALLEALTLIQEGGHQPRCQDDSQSTYARKIDKQEARIDWARSAPELARQVRAFNPFPVSYALWQGERWRCWSAEAVAECGEPGCILRFTSEGLVVACGEGALKITQLQLPGKKVVSAADLLNGAGTQCQPGCYFD